MNRETTNKFYLYQIAIFIMVGLLSIIANECKGQQISVSNLDTINIQSLNFNAAIVSKGSDKARKVYAEIKENGGRLELEIFEYPIEPREKEIILFLEKWFRSKDYVCINKTKTNFGVAKE